MYTVAFFDIGNTLGVVTPSPLHLKPFPLTESLLQSFGTGLGLRLGIITNAGEFNTAQISNMLDAADLLRFFELALVVTSAEIGAEKPKAKIYNCAAARAGVSIGQCLYIGDAPTEVDGAQSAGMGGLLSCLQQTNSLGTSPRASRMNR
jgi:FMN phosphatase YigB (HAD superfamily)